MNFKHIILLAFSFFALAANAQVRTVKAFSEISVSGNVDVKLEKTDSPSVKIKMTSGKAEDLITEVNDNTLVVKPKSKWSGGNGKTSAKVIVYYTQLDEIDVSAGASLQSEGPIQAQDLEVSVSSGARMSIDIDAQEVEVSASSGASAKLMGQCNEAEFDVSSGASIAAADLVAKSVEAEASSGGSIKCHATKSIEAEASSGGSISYDGNPEREDIEKSTSGSIGRNN